MCCFCLKLRITEDNWFARWIILLNSLCTVNPAITNQHENTFVIICSQDAEPLDSVLKQAIPLNGGETRFAVLPRSNYYVIVYWQKFMGAGKDTKSPSNGWNRRPIMANQERRHF